MQRLDSSADYLTLFDFPQHPAIDVAELQRRYYELSRRLHPDRFSNAAAEDLALSVHATALLNTAFRTLRDVEPRGRYWLTRVGENLRDDNRIPPSLAEYVLDVQEQLGELRAQATRGNRERLAELASSVGDKRAAAEHALRALLSAWPEPMGGDPAAGTTDERSRLKRALSELAYLRSLERDVLAAIDTGAAA